MILYVNTCVREDSRTDRIARALLARLCDENKEEYEEIRPDEENMAPLGRASLERRSALIDAGDLTDPMFRFASQFAAADTVVISAPYWDMSFPALLKVYIENICVMGLVSRYSPEGIPQGLCRARRLYYVTTSGGPYVPDFSYAQIQALAKNYFGIPETQLICAENLDIAGSDQEKIISETISELNAEVQPV